MRQESPEPNDSAPPRLPRPLTGFVGRDRDLGALATLLVSPRIRLLTITGPGGIGKTRTALEVIATPEVRAAFPDGIVVVPLAPTNDPALVPAAIAQAFRLEPRADTTAVDALQGAMTQRKILLVLDNCEHLLEAALFFADLLQLHAELTILATSRTRLDLNGEQVFALDPLSPDDARSLFLHRAGAASLRHPHDDAATIDAICTRLDRMPLAIELAAARTATLAPDALLARLANPLPLLRHGPRDAPLRHQTMRDTIAWSYDLLDERQRAGFRRLAIFVGGFTLESAQAVLGDAIDALDLIEFLVDSSLIVPMSAESGIPRFTMLESIRQFGLEQLTETGEEEQVRAAHADTLIELVERVIPEYDGPNLYLTLATITDEMNNIRAALTWSLERGDGTRANRLAGSIWRVWARGEARWLSGHSWRDLWAEGSVWTERALAQRAGVPFTAMIESLIGIGQLLTTLGEAERAAPYAEELLARAEAEAHPYAEYWAHLTLAEIARQRDDRPTALRHAEAALATAPHVRDPQNQIAGAEIILGQLQLMWGDPAAAETHLLAAIAAGQASQNSRHIAVAAFLVSMADVLLDQREQAIHHALLVFQHLEILHDHAHYQGPTLSVARVALRYDLPEIAVQLCAYAATLPHQYTSVEIDETVLAPFRAALPEPAFGEAWATGTRLTHTEVKAIAEHLANRPDRAAAPRATAPEALSAAAEMLSERQRDVVDLLVAGKTNKEIAEILSISPRTAEKHVLNIMDKVGVETRTAIVAWALRNGFA